MEKIKTAVTGNEAFNDLSNPLHALTQFYYAFNNRDIDVMSENWHQSDEVAMDNPLGGIKRGWKEIKEVYDKIFNGQAKVYVEFYDYTIHETNEMFYVVGRERGSFIKNELSIELQIRTSRIFKKVNNSWRQVHHHGSIEYPDLLKSYQDAVMK